MAETRPKDYPKLKNYQPTKFMLPDSHYEKAKADRAVKFIENLRHTKGKWAGKRFWLLPWQEQTIKTTAATSLAVLYTAPYSLLRRSLLIICVIRRSIDTGMLTPDVFTDINSASFLSARTWADKSIIASS